MTTPTTSVPARIILALLAVATIALLVALAVLEVAQ